MRARDGFTRMNGLGGRGGAGGLVLVALLSLGVFLATAAAALANVEPQVAARAYHSLALRTDGTLWAWGRNVSGQLGDGTTIQRTAPVRIGASTGKTWTNVATGDDHTVAVATDGTLWTWGGGNPLPVRIGQDTGKIWASVAAGNYFSLALATDGTLWAWGANGSGQLGDGTTINQTTPVRVAESTGKNWASVAAAYNHTIALATDGTLWGWGDNSWGQLGNGTSLQQTAPIQIAASTGKTWASVAAGDHHTVALATDGTLWGWGNNFWGQLGDGTWTSRPLPVQVALNPGKNWASVAAGSDHHTLAIATDGTLWAWGYNKDGELGDGTTTPWRPLPVQIGASTGKIWTSIAAGEEHSLAVATDGTLSAWGHNGYGQLGNGASLQVNVPVELSASRDRTWAGVAAGDFHTVAVASDATVWTWGYNGYGQLGDGTTDSRTAPVQVGRATGKSWAKAAAGYYHTMALATDGTLWAWGHNGYGLLGTQPFVQTYEPGRSAADTGKSWASVAAGYLHTVAVATDGTLWGWGYNEWGQLGDGTTTTPAAPVQIALNPGKSWAEVAAGFNHTLAAATDGSLWAWGTNSGGQLGDGTTTQRTTPVRVGEDTGKIWASVAAGGSFSLALATDGTLWAWGAGSNGALGDGTGKNRPMPVRVGESTGKTWASVSAGNAHTVAVATDGTLWAWGENSYGQLGDGTWTSRLSPVQVGAQTGKTWAAASAGAYHTVAIASDGSVWAWGGNDRGQRGDGSRIWVLTPEPIMQLDVSPPTVGATPAGQTSPAPFTVSLVADEPALIYYTVDGSTPDTNSPVYDGPILMDQKLTLLQFFGEDEAGNVSPVQAEEYYIGYKMDLTVEGLGTVHTSPGTDLQCKTGTCVEVYDPGTVVTLIARPDPNWSFFRWTGFVSAPAPSLAMLMSADRTLTATFRRNPWAWAVTQPNPTACNQTVTFDHSASLGSDLFTWDFGDGHTWEGTDRAVTHAYGRYGTYRAWLTVKDTVSGWTDGGYFDIYVNQGNQAPVANGGGPYSTDLGQAVTLNGSGSSDPNAACGDSIVQYRWTVGSGGLTLAGATPSLTAAQIDALGVGTHPVLLQVTDSFGATASASTTLAIYDNRPFAAATVAPNPSACSQTVSFDGSRSTHGRPDRTIVSYAWSFGDGTTASGPIASHAYGAYGSYTVTLTVTDNNVPAKTSSTTVVALVNQGNLSPIANAGGPYTITVGNGVTLDGRGSSDPNAACGDSIVSYQWYLPSTSTTPIATGPNPTISWSRLADVLSVGTSSLRLQVTDEFGATSTAATSVSVYSLTTSTGVITSAASIEYNQAVTFTASVTSSHPLHAPTGTVQFQVDGVNFGAPVTLTGGQASLTTSTLTAGSHTVSAIYSGDGALTGSTGTLAGGQSVNRAPATVMLEGLSQVYDGNPKPVTVTTVPAGLAVAVSYSTLNQPPLANGTATGVPDQAGTYGVTAVITDPNYTGLTTGVVTIVPAPATLSLDGLTQTYDGSAKTVDVVTDPAGLSGVSVSYSAPAPTAVGSYAVVARLANRNYTAPEARGTLVIQPASGSTVSTGSAQVPSGEDVVVQPLTEVEVTFATVDEEGSLTATVLTEDVGPGLTGYSPVPGAGYELQPAGSSSGPYRVCVSYDPASLRRASNEPYLRLYHLNGEVWDDVTIPPVDVVQHQVCGETESFSPFMVVEPLGSALYTITGSTYGNGAISPSGETTVPEGGNQAYTFTPAAGYEVHDVVVDFFSQGPLPSYTFENVAADHTISVRFAPIMVTITASSNEGGTIGAPGARQYVYGSSAVYQITPAPGHHIVDVLVDGVSQGVQTSYTFDNITAPHTIQAVFAENTPWTITASSTGSGSLTPPGNSSVLEGLNQTYIFSPAAGWRVGSVVVDGVDRGVQTSWSFSNVTANHALTVAFVPDTLTIAASASTGGTITPSGTTTLARGGAQTYTFNPAAGYKVQDVVVNFFSQGPSESYTFINVQADQTISVSFSQLTYTVTASANTGGTIGPSGTKEYVHGSTPSYTVTAAAGYNLTEVLVDGVSQGAVTTYTFPSLTASHTIQAVFTVKPSYTITAGSTGSGTVTPGTTTVLEGLSQSFTFAPAAGWRVGSVIVDGVNKGAQTSWSFSNVTADHTLTVNFINGYTINASAGANGSISPSGATPVARGGSQTFDFTPNAGYKVKNVLVNFLSKGPLASYTFTNVQADQTISVTFTPLTYTITATAGANGTIGPAGTREYVRGASATYYVTPSPGYKIADVLVDGGSVGPVGSYTFGNISAAHTISATFAVK